jgi:hypothetical protein
MAKLKIAPAPAAPQAPAVMLDQLVITATDNTGTPLPGEHPISGEDLARLIDYRMACPTIDAAVGAYNLADRLQGLAALLCGDFRARPFSDEMLSGVMHFVADTLDDCAARLTAGRRERDGGAARDGRLPRSHPALGGGVMSAAKRKAKKAPNKAASTAPAGPEAATVEKIPITHHEVTMALSKAEAALELLHVAEEDYEGEELAWMRMICVDVLTNELEHAKAA